MASDQLREIEPGIYRLHGPLTFDSVPDLWQAGLRLITRHSAITLDLQGLTRTDSAGLAVMVEWMRVARQHSARLQFRNVPAQLRALARTAGLERLFTDDSA